MKAPVKRYVRCTVSQGQFATEFYVSVPNSSAFVSKNNVRVPQPPTAAREVVDGEVLAFLIDEGQGKNEALIELMGEPVVGGLRTWIPKKDLVGA